MRGIPSYAFSNGASSNGSCNSIRDLGCSSSGNGIPSSFGMLSRISEIENDEKIGTREESQFYRSNFPLYGNNGSSNYSGNFSGLKREIDTDQSFFSDNQVKLNNFNLYYLDCNLFRNPLTCVGR